MKQKAGKTRREKQTNKQKTNSASQKQVERYYSSYINIHFKGEWSKHTIQLSDCINKIKLRVVYKKLTLNIYI